MKFISMIILLAILIGVGAEASAPGKLLYPIKINGNERVREILNISDQRELQWLSEKSERRLDEIRQLSESDNLNQKMMNDLNDKISKVVDDLLSKSSEIAEQGRADKAIWSNVKTRHLISAEIWILNSKGYNEFSEILEENVEKLDGNISSLNSDVGQMSQAFIRNEADSHRKKAEEKLSDLQDEFNSEDFNPDDQMASYLQTNISLAEDKINSGGNHSSNVEFGLAIVEFVEARGLLAEIDRVFVWQTGFSSFLDSLELGNEIELEQIDQ